MPTSDNFILYNYFRSSASYRVRIALELKQIVYEYRAVHLVHEGGEQHSATYRTLNPSREVPTLIHNGKVIAQSIAIIDYIDAIVPRERLFPKDPYQRALVMQACEVINSGAQPLGNLRVLKLLSERFSATEPQKEAWTQHWINYGLATLEEFLKPYAGKYCFGDSVTASDCFLVPHMFNANRFKVPTDAYPILKRVAENCALLESFSRAEPSRQPDFK